MIIITIIRLTILAQWSSNFIVIVGVSVWERQPRHRIPILSWLLEVIEEIGLGFGGGKVTGLLAFD